jgi:hypothetical protein
MNKRISTNDYESILNSKENVKKFNDIIFIGKKLIELEYLKNILFDQDELYLFNLLTLKYDKKKIEESEIKEYEERVKYLSEKSNIHSDFNTKLKLTRLLEYITGVNSLCLQ